MAVIGTFRTSADVRLESSMRTKVVAGGFRSNCRRHPEAAAFSRVWMDKRKHVPGSRQGALLAMRSAPIPVLFLADVLDRHHVLVFRGVEHDHALRGSPRDADAFDGGADQLALVGDQHDLIAVLD